MGGRAVPLDSVYPDGACGPRREDDVEFQDYYKTLGVARDASAEDIKRAYRKLALEWHPDRHAGDEKEAAERRFKQISEAYEVLKDEEKRKKYDKFGENWEHGQEFRPPPGGRTMSREEFEEAFGSSGAFSDFFTSMFGDDLRRGFGGGFRRQHARYSVRGADVRAELALAIGDALAGGTRRFEVPGTQSCPACGGVGFVEEHVCPACGGVGQVHRTRTVDLTIPKNLRDGATLRLKGLGEPGSDGGEAGDLLLTLRLRDDRGHRVVGADLEAEVTVAPWDLLDGTKADVRGAKGLVTLKVPPGTKAGRKLRVPGHGLDDGRGGRGDLYAVVRCALPDGLTERQKELLREARDAGPSAVGDGATGGDA